MRDVANEVIGMDAGVRSLRVLLVEDDLADAALIQRILERGGLSIDCEVVESREEFLDRLEAFRPEIVLSDFNLSSWTGLDVLHELRRRDPGIPFILVTGTQTDEMAAECVHAGADDYLLKHGLVRLPSAVQNALARRQAERERAGAEQRLRRLQEQYRLIAEHTGDLISLLDPDGRYLWASPSHRAVIGYGPEELVGSNLCDRLAPEDRGRLRAILPGTGIGVAREYEFRLRHRDGSWRDIEGTGRRVAGEDGQPDVIVSVARDASERKAFLRAVEDAAREWRATFDAIGDSVTLIDLDRKVVRGNRAAAALAGLSPEATIGRTICDLIGCPMPQDECPSSRMQATRRRETERVQVGERWFQVAVDPRTDAAGNVVGGVHIVTDITREKIDEMRLLESYRQMERAMDGVIRSMGRTVESRDPYTAGHQHRVARLARSIAIEMGLDGDTVTGVYTAAEIHDIGKIAVPSEILVRPGRLSPVEFDLIKSHVIVGSDILRSIDFPWPVADMVRQHHERQDGSGYPDGLRGAEILVGSAILAVADVVEAMASHRPYRPALGIDVAIQEIVAGRGSRYDATVVDACLVVVKDPKILDGE